LGQRVVYGTGVHFRTVKSQDSRDKSRKEKSDDEREKQPMPHDARRDVTRPGATTRSAARRWGEFERHTDSAAPR
jgi:hypothetical protein